MEKQEVLNELYALRAGLSVISQQYDKALSIEDDCDGKLAENAKNFSGDLVWYERRPWEYDTEHYFLKLEKLQDRYGYVENYEDKIEAGEIEKDETVKAASSWEHKIDENYAKGRKAFNRWLADDECDAYFNRILQDRQNKQDSTINYSEEKKSAKKGKILSIVFFSIAVVFAIAIAALFAGDCRNIIAITIYLILPFVVFTVLGIVFICKSKSDKAAYKRKVEEAKGLLAAAQWLVDNLPQNKERVRAILKEKDNRIAPISKSCNEFYMALAKRFNPLLDERDWAHLDLVIFELETRRADTVKEALQLVDRELQTERIQLTIVQATEQICYEIRRGFARLEATIVRCCEAICAQLAVMNVQLAGISEQLSELTDSVNLGNALQAKANVTSSQLLSTVNHIRYYN